MTKKHFIALANSVRDLENEIIRQRDREIELSVEWVCDRIEEHLAYFCQTQNGMFNRNRWIGYIRGECGPNGGRRV